MHPFLCIGFKLWVSSTYEVNWTAHLYEIQVTHPRIDAISHFKSALKKKKFGGNNKKVERLLWNCQRWNQGKATRMGRYHEGIFTCFFEALKAVTLSVFLSLSADQQLLSLFLSHHSPPPYIFKQYRELNSGMLPCRFNATQINMLSQQERGLAEPRPQVSKDTQHSHNHIVIDGETAVQKPKDL